MRIRTQFPRVYTTEVNVQWYYVINLALAMNSLMVYVVFLLIDDPIYVSISKVGCSIP